jgi:hypothetical protein
VGFFWWEGGGGGGHRRLKASFIQVNTVYQYEAAWKFRRQYNIEGSQCVCLHCISFLSLILLCFSV